MISSLPTIAKAVAQFREGRAEPCELVDACLDRIRRLDDRVHAWILVDAAETREQAKRLGRLAKQGNIVGPLHGIPVGIKDIIDVEGLPTAAGSRLREGQVAQRDAPLVSRLKQAGAIVMGKTVTTEFACFDPPPTRNPWHLDHTPGGSSSGSAAAIATGMCLGAVGSQTGGSIVRPASYCGVAGLKPTWGNVSLEGVVPVSPQLDHVGPLARNLDDLARLYLAMAEPPAMRATLGDLRDAGILVDPRTDDGIASQACQIWDEIQFDQAARPTIGVLEEPFLSQASDEVRTVTRRALDHLAKVVSRDLTLPESYGEAHVNHRRVMAFDAAEYHRRDYASSSQEYGPRISELIEEGLAVSDADYAAALEHRTRFRRDALQLFVNGTLGILPSTNTAAPDRLDTTGDPKFNSPWSYAGFPTVTIPCGLTDGGMPCGLQLVGPPHSEMRLLRAAIWCEKRFGFTSIPPILQA